MTHKVTRSLGVCLALGLSVASSFAQVTATSPVAPLNQALQKDQALTEDALKLNARLEDLRAQERQLRLEIPTLEIQKRRLERYIAGYEKKNAALKAEQARFDEIALLLEDDLALWVERLSVNVEGGSPFLMDERRRRVNFLRESLNDANLDIGEKARRVLEALNVEADYGVSYEARPEVTRLDGQETTLLVLRVGRIAQFALTADRAKAARWVGDDVGFKTEEALLEPVRRLHQAMTSRFIHQTVHLPVEAKEVRHD